MSDSDELEDRSSIDFMAAWGGFCAEALLIGVLAVIYFPFAFFHWLREEVRSE